MFNPYNEKICKQCIWGREKVSDTTLSILGTIILQQGKQHKNV